MKFPLNTKSLRNCGSREAKLGDYICQKGRNDCSSLFRASGKGLNPSGEGIGPNQEVLKFTDTQHMNKVNLPILCQRKSMSLMRRKRRRPEKTLGVRGMADRVLRGDGFKDGLP